MYTWFRIGRAALLGAMAALALAVSAPQAALAQKAPTLISLSPTSASAGGPAFTLTLTGKNFTSDCVAKWNGSSRPTTYVSSSHLTATISATDIAAAGTVSVTVFRPPSATSASKSFTVIGFPPAVPTGFSATSAIETTGPGAGTGAVDLVWNPSQGATSYQVFRKRPADSGYSLFQTVAAPQTTCRDTSILAREIYSYYVKASNASGDSAASIAQQALGLATLTFEPDIAYYTGGKIMVMAADGSNPTPVALGNGNPTWSPDGQKIAFDDGNAIWIINRDGTGRFKAADANLPDDGHYGVSWSPVPTPDGQYRIAFSDGGDLFVVKPDGTGRRQLTFTPNVNDTGEIEMSCSWSPDANRLAVSTTTWLTQYEPEDPLSADRIVVLTLGAGGGGLEVANRTVLLEDGSGDVFLDYPDWSRTGNSVAFITINLLDSPAFRLRIVDVTVPGVAWEPFPGWSIYTASWSPDDSRIVFDSFNGTLYKATFGGEPEVLGSGLNPAWRRNP